MEVSSEGKVSLVVTVKNEASTVKALLDSVATQTRLPDEAVVVDGGSSDGTLELLRGLSASGEYRFPIRVVSSPGANIPAGRNIGVRGSSHPIIAITDAGCRLHSGWLDAITQPIREGRAEAVGGMTLGWHETEFEEICSSILFMGIEYYRSQRAQPSARTLAFSRKAWENAGGFSEITNMAEDTAFVMRLRSSSTPIDYAPDAIVYWRARGSTGAVFRQFYGYSWGDGFRGLFPLRYGARYLALAALILILALFWWTPLSWALVASAFLIELWLEWVRKVPRLSPHRLATAFKIALAIEAGLTLGYPLGVFSRLLK